MFSMLKIFKSFFILLLVIIFILSSIPTSADNRAETNENDIDNKRMNRSTLCRRGEIKYYYETFNWSYFNSWNISGDDVINNNTDLHSSIIIRSGGSLTVENATIFINNSEMPVVITVEEDAVLYINNSNFTLKDIKTELGYKFFIYGELIINNSELNYLGYLKNICVFETCSGTREDPEFSTGIELISNSNSIKNTIIKYSLSTAIFVNGSSNNIIEDNLFSNNTNSIAILDSDNTIVNNKFYDNYVGIEIENSNVLIINASLTSTFPDSMKIPIGGYLSEITLSNCSITNTNVGFYFLSVDLKIYDLEIKNVGYTGIMNSNLLLKDCRLDNIIQAFSLINVSGSINGCIFEKGEKGIEITNSKGFVIENNSITSASSWGLEVQSCLNITIKNNHFSDNVVGIFSMSSKIKITDNEIMNSSYIGVDCEYTYAILENNSIHHTMRGINLHYAIGEVRNNTIVRNQDGISCDHSDFLITNNIIANNTGWGINITGDEPEILENQFSTQKHNPNKHGRIIKITDLNIHVKDLYGKYIYTYNLVIQKKNYEQPEFDQRVTRYGPYHATVSEYMVSNTGNKIEFSEYHIIASWGSDEVYSKDSKVVNIQIDNEIDLILSLPDLYITPDDIKLSNINPKYEENLEIIGKIHYNGTIPAEDVIVRIYANKVKIDELTISFPGSNDEQIKTINSSWIVSNYMLSPMGIRIEIETNPVENRNLGYDLNNSAGKIISIDEDIVDEQSWNDDTSAVLCSIILLIIFIIILILLFLIARSRKGRSQEQIPSVNDLKSINKSIEENDRNRKYVKTTTKPAQDTKNSDENISKVKQKNRNKKMIGKKLKSKYNGKNNGKNIDIKSAQTRSRSKKTLKEKFRDERAKGPSIKW